MENYRLIPGVILIALGLSALLHVDIWAYLWPLFLILMGVRLINRSPKSNFGDSVRQEEVRTDSINMETIFGASNKKIINDDFQGGKVTNVFGGGEIDLREAKIKGDAPVTLEVNAIFGGIKIMVPREWSVNTQVVGVLGGFGNETSLPKKGEEKGRLVIKGSAVFGGGEVTN